MLWRHISRVFTEASGWSYLLKNGATGAQVDQLPDSQEHCINVCEMKFAITQFIIDKKLSRE